MVPQGASGGIASPLAGRSAPSVTSTPMNFKCRQAYISPKQQRDVALKVHVASVHFKCFRGISQVFHTDVAKVDRDVAHVVMDIQYVSSVSAVPDKCCKCFIWMLQR